MIQLEVNVNFPQDIIQRLSLLASPDFASQILDEAGAILLNRIRTRFLAETDPDGVPWVPSHAAIRRRQHGGTGTLFDTGTLFRSIQLSGSGPNERVIGTDVPYAKMHQEGLNGQVKRVFLGFSDDDVEVANNLVALRIKQLVGAV